MSLKLSKDELQAKLKQSLGFLERSGKSFDDGYWEEAYRLAAVIRVLVHDTKNCKSLFKQLKAKDTIKYFSTPIFFNKNNLLLKMPLVRMKLENTKVKISGIYIPQLDDFLQDRKWKAVSFNSWWGGAVIRDKNRYWTRNELVLTLADKEGGTHVDPTIDDEYARLTRENAAGWVIKDAFGERPFENGVETATVRQIAYELEKTTRKSLTHLLI